MASAQLPPPILDWFTRRGWTPRSHQMDMLETARAGEHALLIAPTGGGKTLGGFLPSLVDLYETLGQDAANPRRKHALHTLYISPLKALSVDVARNLVEPVDEMGLGLRIETRTGDTSASKRQRQRAHPPDILLTTPEQLARRPLAGARCEPLAQWMRLLVRPNHEERRMPGCSWPPDAHEEK